MGWLAGEFSWGHRGCGQNIGHWSNKPQILAQYDLQIIRNTEFRALDAIGNNHFDPACQIASQLLRGIRPESVATSIAGNITGDYVLEIAPNSFCDLGFTAKHF